MSEMLAPNVISLKIWLDPEHESTVDLRTLAEYVGVPLQTIKDRMARLGPDHYLTYYPGKIPSKVRRISSRSALGGKGSLLKSIRIERLADSMNPELAYEFITKLVTFSKRDFALRRCEESKNFLLNKNQMLEWYIECIPGIDCERFLSEIKEWVESQHCP